jgi:hypothetical protein
MNWAAFCRWIVSNQLIFDWMYGTAAVVFVGFVFMEVLRGRLLSPRLVDARHTRRGAEERQFLATSLRGETLRLAELELEDTHTQTL